MGSVEPLEMHGGWLRNLNHQLKTVVDIPLIPLFVVFLGFQHVSTIRLVMQDFANIRSVWRAFTPRSSGIWIQFQLRFAGREDKVQTFLRSSDRNFTKESR